MLAVLVGWVEVQTGGVAWPRSLLVSLPLAVPVVLRTPLPLLAAVLGGLVLPASLWEVSGAESLAAVAVPMLALYSAGRALSLAGAGFALATCVASIGVAVRASAGLHLSDAVVLSLGMLLAVGVGRASREMLFEADQVREEAARAARQHEQDVAAATADERLRIARELHDVLGHAISVMGLQAAAVRRRLRPEQQVESDALLAVEGAGRQAVEELRRLLGVLRTPSEAGDEAFGLGSSARAAAVVDEVRAAGLQVESAGIEHVDDLNPALALTVVRIVQEGLTNALRHAPASRASVRVDRADGWLTITVEDDGGGRVARVPSDGHGFGLVGMAERVSVFGGTLEAGPREESGFALRAALPEVAR
ncbi:hypothetical protein GCM10009815_21880 [Nocardioides marmoribigeumensis]